jgi:hypothetical protein
MSRPPELALSMFSATDTSVAPAASSRRIVSAAPAIERANLSSLATTSPAASPALDAGNRVLKLGAVGLAARLVKVGVHVEQLVPVHRAPGFDALALHGGRDETVALPPHDARHADVPEQLHASPRYETMAEMTVVPSPTLIVTYQRL